jgi:hypothetical protein
LGYLDFAGVNGNTEAERRFRARGETAEAEKALTRKELLKLFARDEAGYDADAIPDWDLGIPMQVEDDSNVLCYGNGFDLALLLKYALDESGSDRILVRPHPGAYFFGSPKGLHVDESPTSMSFVQRCRRLLTLNSSVAVEAMLNGTPTGILGQSPASFAAGTSLADFRCPTDLELDFLLLNYFVPYRLIYDPAYFRWRLARPTEGAIRRRHLQALGS